MRLDDVTLIDSSDGDWQALYINGHKVIEGHSISAEQVLKILHDRGDLHYENREVPSYGEYYETADEENDDPYQSVFFPDYLSESS
jgi:hypothetical protein